jgi:hypothetical protein
MYKKKKEKEKEEKKKKKAYEILRINSLLACKLIQLKRLSGLYLSKEGYLKAIYIKNQALNA